MPAVSLTGAAVSDSAMGALMEPPSVPYSPYIPDYAPSAWGQRAETLSLPKGAGFPAQQRGDNRGPPPPLRTKSPWSTYLPPLLLLLQDYRETTPSPIPGWGRGRRLATSGLSLLVLVRAAEASQTLLQTQTQMQTQTDYTPHSSDLCLPCSRMPTCQGAALSLGRLATGSGFSGPVAALDCPFTHPLVCKSTTWAHRDQTPSSLHLPPTPPQPTPTVHALAQSPTDWRTDRRIRDSLGPQSVPAASPAAACLSDLFAVLRLGGLHSPAVPCGPYFLLLLVAARHLLGNWPSNYRRQRPLRARTREMVENDGDGHVRC
jgi:hypothetical protein